jgi:predicted dehydrogenase
MAAQLPGKGFRFDLATTNGNTINVAVVGCGYWGVNYVRVFDELPNSHVVAVCDVRRERLDWVRSRHKSVGIYADLDDMLNSMQVDALVVSTAATSHYPIARRCLERGKHVLLEKPLTISVEDGEALVDLAGRTELTLMVGHTFLYNDAIRRMKEFIHHSDFGRAYYLHATRTNLGPIRNDVNALWDLAPHDVAIFNYLLDSHPLRVSAVGNRLLGNDREDVGFVTLTYPDGIIANIHVSWADPNKVREVVAVGSRQRVVFDDLNNLERVRIFEKGVCPAEQEADSFGEFRFLLRDGAIISPKIEVREPLKNQCSQFLDCVRSGEQPLSDAHSGLQVVKVMVAIQQSLGLGGAPVEVLP